MDFGLQGRVALVTAATRGIGLGVAQALAKEGARVAVVARTKAEVERVAASLGGFGSPRTCSKKRSASARSGRRSASSA